MRTVPALCRLVRGTPDDVAELLAIAELLAHPPPEATESMFDLINFAARAARRIRAVAGRLEVDVSPKPKRPVAMTPHERREIEARRRRARAVLRLPAGQGTLQL